MSSIPPGQTSRLREWRPGDPVDHRFLNDTNHAVDELRGLIPSPRQRKNRGSAASGAAMFKVESVRGDYILATEFDGETEGEAGIPVAKPYQLRNSLTERDGLTFTYSTTSSRTADSGSETENQVVVPSYVAGDVIFAIRTLRGTGVSYEPTPGAREKVKWLDLNIDGRAWAKESS